MRYRIEVNVLQSDGTLKWQTMRRSAGREYVFETREEAEHVARMCYPDHPEHVRVVEVAP